MASIYWSDSKQSGTQNLYTYQLRNLKLNHSVLVSWLQRKPLKTTSNEKIFQKAREKGNITFRGVMIRSMAHATQITNIRRGYIRKPIVEIWKVGVRYINIWKLGKTHLKTHEWKRKHCGTWVAPSVKRPTPDFSSRHITGFWAWAPCQALHWWHWACLGFVLSTPPRLVCACSLFLSLSK